MTAFDRTQIEAQWKDRVIKEEACNWDGCVRPLSAMSAGGLMMDVNLDRFHANLAGTNVDAGEKEPSVAGSRGGSSASGVKSVRSLSRGSNATASSCLRAELEKEKKGRSEVE